MTLGNAILFLPMTMTADWMSTPTHSTMQATISTEWRTFASISPEWLVKFHTGYELDENDHQDVRLLCERFGIDMPDKYRKFIRKSS